MQTITKILVAVLLFQFTGCAYMFHGNTDQITIQSADPEAKLYLNNVLIGKGSSSATVPRNVKQTISAKKEGCTDHVVQTGDRFDAISLLGLLLDFGIISMLIVDNSTGAMWKTDPLVYHVNPICLSSGQAPTFSQFQDLVKKLSAGFKGKRVPLIAVLPVADASNTGNKPLGNYLTERITNELYATGLVKVVERAQLGKVIEELALTQGGTFDESSAKRIGRFLGVDAIVMGTYAELGNQTVEVTSRIVGVETGEVLGVGTIHIPRSAVQQMLR